MRKRSLVVPTAILQAVIALLGLGALAFLLGEPHFEGRNRHATLFEIYFKDPFLTYVYLGSIPVFVALYQAFRVLDWVREDKALARPALNAMRTIKSCALVTIAVVAGAEVFILLSESDDRAGGVAMGLLVAFGAAVAASAAAMFEGMMRRAMASATPQER